MDPRPQPGTYVFCALGADEVPVGLTPRLLFREPEATTVVVSVDDARSHGLTATFPCEWIVLGVDSDLAAVGFLAEVTARLASAGISTNVVSAYHHDHLFVPAGRGIDAMAVLTELQDAHQGDR